MWRERLDVMGLARLTLNKGGINTTTGRGDILYTVRSAGVATAGPLHNFNTQIRLL